jgi:hypothetical protein
MHLVIAVRWIRPRSGSLKISRIRNTGDRAVFVAATWNRNSSCRQPARTATLWERSLSCRNRSKLLCHKTRRKTTLLVGCCGNLPPRYLHCVRALSDLWSCQLSLGQRTNPGAYEVVDILLKPWVIITTGMKTWWQRQLHSWCFWRWWLHCYPAADPTAEDDKQ